MTAVIPAIRRGDLADADSDLALDALDELRRVMDECLGQGLLRTNKIADFCNSMMEHDGLNTLSELAKVRGDDGSVKILSAPAKAVLEATASHIWAS